MELTDHMSIFLLGLTLLLLVGYPVIKGVGWGENLWDDEIH